MFYSDNSSQKFLAEYELIESVPILKVQNLLRVSQPTQSLPPRFHSRSRSRPVLMINRRSAAEHRDDPTADLEATATVFNQIYEGLKPKTAEDSALDYRYIL